MKLYSIYYHMIGGVIAVAGLAVTPFIPKPKITEMYVNVLKME